MGEVRLERKKGRLTIRVDVGGGIEIVAYAGDEDCRVEADRGSGKELSMSAFPTGLWTMPGWNATHKRDYGQDIIHADADTLLPAQEPQPNDNPKQHPQQRQPDERIPGRARHRNVLPVSHVDVNLNTLFVVVESSNHRNTAANLHPQSKGGKRQGATVL